jgi:hypothetical protein
MTDLLDHIFGTLFTPASAFRRMLEERTPVITAAVIVLTVGICSGAGSMVMQNAVTSMFTELPDFEETMFSPAASMTMNVIVGFISWVVIAGILHVLAKLLGGKGAFTELLVLMGFAALPNIFQAPVGLIAALSGSFTGAFIAMALSGILTIWVLILNVLAMREAHKFSTAMAIITLVLSFVVLSFVALIVLVFMLMMGILLM